MPMTVVITRNVAPRLRGFLASCMIEVAPGVYSAPRMSAGVRERVKKVCGEWFFELHGDESSLVMLWRDPREPGGQGVISLGAPPRTLCDHEGFLLGHLRSQGADTDATLKTE